MTDPTPPRNDETQVESQAEENPTRDERAAPAADASAARPEPAAPDPSEPPEPSVPPDADPHPGPDSREDRSRDGGTRAAARPRTGRFADGIPSEAQCLQQLTQITGLLALNQMEPARAVAMRGNIRELLEYHRRTDARAARAGISDADVADLAARDPQVLNLIASLLTDEQIESLMRRREAGGDGQV